MNFRALLKDIIFKKSQTHAAGFEAIIQVLENIWSSRLLAARLFLACVICVKALHQQQCDVFLSLHLPPGHVFLTLLPADFCPALPLNCSQLTCLKIKALGIARHAEMRPSRALRAECGIVTVAVGSSDLSWHHTRRAPGRCPALDLSPCSTIHCILCAASALCELPEVRWEQEG